MSSEPSHGVRRVGERDEGGFALIATTILSMVALLLIVTMLAQGSHLVEATTYDRRWNFALQLAESGIDEAVQRIKTESVGTSGTHTFNGTMPGGSYAVSLTHLTLGRKRVTSTGSVVFRGRNVSRRVVAEFGPEPNFQYALFSETSMRIKNNSVIQGDVFSNDNMYVEGNSTIHGHVISALGTVEFENNSKTVTVAGEGPSDVYSGGNDPAQGFGIKYGAGAGSSGSSYAQKSDGCPNSDPAKYQILGSGDVGVDAVAAGNISGTTTVTGLRKANTCQQARNSDDLPEYKAGDFTAAQFAELYGVALSAVHMFDPSQPGMNCGACPTPVEAFNALANPLTGVYVVKDPGRDQVLDLTGVDMRQTFVLVTTERIDFDLGANYSTTDVNNTFCNIVSLNSSTSPAAITIKNNFEVTTPGAAVLMYTLGLIDVKNNPADEGAIYAGSMVLKNNLDIAYNPLVEKTLGFGEQRLVRTAWQEVPVIS